MYGNMPLYNNPYMPNMPMRQNMMPNGNNNNMMFGQQPYQQTAQNYQQMIPNYQQQQQQQQQVMWEIVSDLETIKAANTSLDGQPKYYLMSDGTAIYRKQMMNDGTSKIFKYELSAEDTPKQAENVSGDLMAAIQGLNAKVDEINKTVNQITSMWGGGVTDDES